MKYRIKTKSLDSAKLERDALDFLESLKHDKAKRKAASEDGISLDAFDAYVQRSPDSRLIRIEPDSAGIAPGVIELSLIFAPVIAQIVQDIWTHLILPDLKRRYGEDSIEEV